MSIRTHRHIGLMLAAGLWSATSPAVGAESGTLRERFDRADLRLELEKQCAVDPGLKPAQVSKAASDFRMSVGPLLYEEPGEDVRKRLALQAEGRALLARARAENASFHNILKKLSAAKYEEALSALDDLRKAVLTTAQMRAARSAIADVVVRDGQVTPVLRGGPLEVDLFAAVGPVVWRALDQARREGIDCSSTEFFRFFQPAAPDPSAAGYSVIKQGDLQRIYDQAVKLSEEYSAKLEAAHKANRTAEKADIKPVMEMYSEAETLHTKAMRVLAVALDQHDVYVDALPGRAPRKPPPPPPAAEKAEETPSPSPTPAPKQKPVAKKVEPPPPEVTLEQRKAALIGDINRQADVLRNQRGLIGTAPVGVANNLLGRLKRVSQVADMLAETTDEVRYEARLSEDRIQIVYAKSKGDLKNIRIDVTERFESDVLLSWYIVLDRQDDANFRIASEFNEVQASMEVVQAELKKYPNYHQLMVLMNRLSEIMDKK